MGSDARTDQELVAAINHGDLPAFEVLYHRHRDWIVRLALRFAGNEADALDVLQETWQYVLGKTPQLQLNAAMTTFLYPVVRNLAIATRRKRNRFISPTDETDLPAPPTPPAPLVPPDTTTAIQRADLAWVLAVLPGGQREVLLMRFVDDMSLEEIALSLGIPLGTVKSRLHLALADLRQNPRTREYFETG